MGGSEVMWSEWASLLQSPFFLNIFFTGIHHENEHFGVLCEELTEVSVMTSSLRISQPPAQWKLEESRSQAWLHPALLASGSHVQAQCLLSPLPCPCASWQIFV